MPKGDRAALSRELSRTLADSGAADLFGSVIANDRRRAGRAPAARGGQDAMTSHAVIVPYDNLTNGQPDPVPASGTGHKADPVAAMPADMASDGRGGGPAARCEPGIPPLLEGRVAEARRMAASLTTTVTLRIPRELNDWLDEYIHRAWPEKVRKQDLVAEALRIAFARRGRPGEPVLPTPLLPVEAS
jgi:hypothetical protein